MSRLEGTTERSTKKVESQLSRALARELALGEDSTRQFKRDISHGDALAAEMAAFANSEGGKIYLGVADDGTAPGLSSDDVKRLNQLIGNTASHSVRSPLTVSTKNVALPSGRVVIVLTVPKGLDKPYFDRNGVIWLKAGADKRRVNSKEELRRLFQVSDQFHADELPTKAGIDAIEEPRLRDFLKDTYGQELPSSTSDRKRLLANMNLASSEGVLNLAGLLLFGREPQRFKPQFMVKAVKYPGTDIHPSTYDDTEDFNGPLRSVFDHALAFVLRNLRKVQAGRGVNSLGIPEIPPVALEELLVNALVHRDYLVSAPVRIFVFDDRIEIVSPGTLPNSLTVEKIRAGNSNLRNPILASFVAKGLLPYRGLGSGIPRAMDAWPHIELRDDREGGLFVATVRRKVGSRGPEWRPEWRPESRPQRKPDSRPEWRPESGRETSTEERVLGALSAGALSRLEIARAIGQATVSGHLKKVVSALLGDRAIEFTIPEKPGSRLQKYRLSPRGRARLRAMN